MKTQELLNRLAVALGIPEGQLTLADSTDSIAEWDSIGHLNVLSELESHFGSVVEDNEIRRFTTIRQLVDGLRTRNLLED
ncbi:MAG: acyl carrier protein [bacterium]